MPYDYICESRRNNPYALPDVEIWRDAVYEVTCACGVYLIPGCEDGSACPSCDAAIPATDLCRADSPHGYWYQYGSPGYLADSGIIIGPFDTAAFALADARTLAGYCAHGVDDTEPCEPCEAEMKMSITT